jgi:DNA replication and repair protein RecF
VVRTPRITRLRLTDFRSFAALDTRFDARLIALCGDNGVGKTNLLEALSLLSPGRGLRRASLAEAARVGGDGGFAIAAEIGEAGNVAMLGTGGERDPASPNLTRKSRVNGAPVTSSAAFSEHVRLVWLTPSLDGLFNGPAGDRRRFVDRLVLAIDPNHAGRSAGFDQALRSRNRLLEQNSLDHAWLDALEHQIAELGVAIAFARTETIDRLDALLAARPDESSLFPFAQLKLAGEMEMLIAGRSAIAAEDEMRRRLRDSRARDRAAGRTLIGPQTSDLIVIYGPKGVEAARASTGEQKALLLGLVMAHARLVAEMSHIYPLLLLDEVAAHLDPARRHALFAVLANLGGQVWMTGADRALFRDLPMGSALFVVTPGQLRLAAD